MKTIDTECQEFLCVLLVEALELLACVCQNLLEESGRDGSVVIPESVLQVGEASDENALKSERVSYVCLLVV